MVWDLLEEVAASGKAAACTSVAELLYALLVKDHPDVLRDVITLALQREEDDDAEVARPARSFLTVLGETLVAHARPVLDGWVARLRHSLPVRTWERGASAHGSWL